MSSTTLYLPRATSRDKRIAPPRAYGRYAIALRLRDAVVSLAHKASAGNSSLRLLDLGCGDMPYRPLLSPHLASYDGIDLPGNPAAKYHLLPDGTTTAPAASADLILSTQVLEHVRNVPAYLTEARRLLAPGGQLLLTTHGTWVYHADPHDYWRWTAEGLTTTLADHGFSVTHLDGLLGLMPLGIQLFQDGLVRKLPKLLRNPTCLLLQQSVLLADRFHSADDRRKNACVYALIASKDS